jgi:hypothetical protein
MRWKNCWGGGGAHREKGDPTNLLATVEGDTDRASDLISVISLRYELVYRQRERRVHRQRETDTSRGRRKHSQRLIYRETEMDAHEDI